MQKLIKLFVSLREKSLIKKLDYVLVFYDKENLVVRILFKNDDEVLIYETAKDVKERDKKIGNLQKAYKMHEVTPEITTRIECNGYIITAGFETIDGLIRVLNDYVDLNYKKSIDKLVEKHYQIDPYIYPQNDLMREFQTKRPTLEQLYLASYPKYWMTT